MLCRKAGDLMNGPAPITTSPALDVEKVRADFPILQRKIHGKPLVYFDTAASAQRPLAVIEAVDDFYRNHNANIHRGVHTLSQEATEDHEQARAKIGGFINAPSDQECVFTRGTTEAINLVAHSFLRPRLKAGDEILITWMEHHSNIVPWQLLCEETGAVLKVVPINQRGELQMDVLAEMLTERVKLLGVVQVSNALGTVNPVAEICALARQHGVPVLVDGAQAMPHQAVDVQALDCDFYTFSGHKLFGPTGIGVLWGKEDLLNAMPPFFGGGEMIETVSFEGTTFNTLPFKFEAGTPNIAGVVGLGAAIKYLNGLDREAAAAHEVALLQHTLELAGEIEGLRRIGNPHHAAGIFSFLLEGTHPSDLGMLLDQQGIAVRTGHHCAQPLMDFYGIPGTARASYSIYNTHADVEALFAGIRKAKSLFG
jgi:cysteine desulfurase/selenocysteine lyase